MLHESTIDINMQYLWLTISLCPLVTIVFRSKIINDKKVVFLFRHPPRSPTMAKMLHSTIITPCSQDLFSFVTWATVSNYHLLTCRENYTIMEWNWGQIHLVQIDRGCKFQTWLSSFITSLSHLVCDQGENSPFSMPTQYLSGTFFSNRHDMPEWCSTISQPLGVEKRTPQAQVTNSMSHLSLSQHQVWHV